jgi:hypothetical protein
MKGWCQLALKVFNLPLSVLSHGSGNGSAT